MKNPFENPWQTLETRAIYENAWIGVREDQVVRPDGKAGIYGVVSMRNRAIAILPIHDDETVTLVGQFRYTVDEYSWEIPEGGGAFDETPLAAAQRELREETGLVAENWTEFGRAHLSNSVTDEAAFIFLATGLEQREAQPEGTELLEIRRWPFAKVLSMAQHGEITDSMSLIAIYRYACEREGAPLSRGD
jgi:8-oxo-dGTP pyrophosphatase MutT (NUDIX family)